MPFVHSYSSAPGPEHFRNRGSLSPEQKGKTYEPTKQDLAHYAAQQLNPYSEIAIESFRPHLKEIMASIALKSVTKVVASPSGPELKFS